jgi:hypothetical protein
MQLPDKLRTEPLGKKEIIALARTNDYNILAAGETDPLKLKIQIKRLIEYLGEIDNQLSDASHTEALHYGEKTFELDGAEVNICDLGVRYDYTGDHEWTRLNMAETEIALKRKERENYLKALKEPITVVDEETGEIRKVNPAVRTAKEGIKILL